MSKVFILGLGGSGSSIVRSYLQNNKNNENIYPLIIDTDQKTFSDFSTEYTLDLSINASVHEVVLRVGKDNINHYFPTSCEEVNSNFIRRIKMNNGANLWRQQGILAFEDFIRRDKDQTFYRLIDRIFDEYEEGEVIQFYVVTSICGGTGSGLLLPLTLYIKKYIKEKFNVDIKFNGLLTCPDLYVDKLTSENKEKALANAYATMQEINAVDVVTKGYNFDTQNKSFTIDFKLNLFGEELFDAHEKKYCNRKYFPFENIYLLDRIPSVETLINHEIHFAGVLNMLINDYEKISKQSDVVYKSLFVKKIVYPFEYTLNYVQNKKVLEDFKNEWMYFFDYAYEKINYNNEIELRVSKHSSSKYVNITDQLNNSKILDRDVLNRIIPDHKKDNIKYMHENEKACLQERTLELYDSIKNRCKLIDSESLENTIDVDLEIKPLSIFDSKNKKLKKKQVIIDEIDRFIINLKKFIFEKVTDIENSKNSIIEEIVKPFIDSLLKDDNKKYVHPLIAYVRLNLFYDNLNKSYNYNSLIDIYSPQIIENYDKMIIPTDIYQVIFRLNSTKNSYFNIGSDRFLYLIENKYFHLNNLKEDYEFIKADMLEVINNVKSYFLKYYYRILFDYTKVIIDKYYQLFKRIKNLIPDFEEELKYIRNEGCFETSILKNIKSNDKYKEQVYEVFDNNYDYSGDDVIGKTVYEFVNNHLIEQEPQFTNNDVRDLYQTLSLEFRKIILEDEDIKRLISKNIIQIIQANNLFENESLNTELRKKISPLINGNNPSLLINTPRGDDKNSPVIYKTINISNGIRDFIVNNKDFLNYDSSISEDIVNRFFFIMGNTEKEIVVNNTLNDNEIVLIDYVNNLHLDWFIKLNECEKDNQLFKAYYKIVSEERVQLSELWNPHIFNLTNNNTSLIYLNNEKQKEYEETFSKAVIWSLLNELIYIDYQKDKDDFKPIYYLVVNGKNTIPTINNEPILSDAFGEILKYIRLNYGFIYKNAKKYDEYLFKLTNEYKSLARPTVSEEFILNKIKATELFNVLNNKLKLSKGNDNKKLIHILYEVYESDKKNKDCQLILAQLGKDIKNLLDVITFESAFNSDKFTKEIVKEITNDNLYYISDKNVLSKVISWTRKHIF